MKSISLLALFVAALGTSAAQVLPVITSVENAASNIPPGLPNSKIALGSMFVVKGSNLGPANVVVANSFPLQTTLAGTSIRVTVGDRTVSAIMYYTLDRQVAAILPSNAFAGAGTLTVFYNSQASATFPITIVVSNAAIFTVDTTGSGPGIVTLGDYSLVTPSNAPNPGEPVVLWGTGLGPVTSDETLPAPGGDMTLVLEAFIGGLPSEILYKGRNPCCSGIDQINVRVPPGISGCSVPITLQTAGIVSNTVTIPVATTGRACTPTSAGVSQQDYQSLQSRQNPVRGSIVLSRDVVTQLTLIPGVPPVPNTTHGDNVSAIFQRFIGSTGASVLNAFGDVPSVGSCVVTVAEGPAEPLGQAPSVASLLLYQALDAGSSLDVNGPAGTRSVARQAVGGAISYSATLGPGTARNYFDVGEHTVSGKGGADIGVFSARVTAPPALNWTNQASLATVNRSFDSTFLWTGWDPLGLVQISGTSRLALAGANGAAVTFTCTARASDGHFTVPSLILLGLPASATALGQVVQGSLSIKGVASAPFAAPGLDFGTVSYVHAMTQSVVFQ